MKYDVELIFRVVVEVEADCPADAEKAAKEATFNAAEMELVDWNATEGVRRHCGERR